jgi:hypothetical protein
MKHGLRLHCRLLSQYFLDYDQALWSLPTKLHQRNYCELFRSSVHADYADIAKLPGLLRLYSGSGEWIHEYNDSVC